MMARESSTTPFNIPEEVLSVLPSDPFEQLDVARKITSVALSTRISSLESESSVLREKLAEKDDVIAGLTSQVDSFEAALSDVSDKLAQAELDKENLLKENASLSSTVKKLQRDVSKLDIFRKTLMQSLKEDEESPVGVLQIIAKPTPTEEDASLPSSRYSSIGSNISDIGTSFAEDHQTEVSKPAILLASQKSTPRLTPPGSPPSLSASMSPTRTSKPVSPRRHSVAFSTTRGILDDRSSMFSSMPSSQPTSISSFDSGSNTGRTRVDGKEFFRQVRSRLSYEQFGAFLASVKEFNSHKQTKEETLRKADEIFGPDNKDLYAIFEGLIMRNVR